MPDKKQLSNLMIMPAKLCKEQKDVYRYSIKKVSHCQKFMQIDT